MHASCLRYQETASFLAKKWMFLSFPCFYSVPMVVAAAAYNRVFSINHRVISVTREQPLKRMLSECLQETNFFTVVAAEKP